jgi:hypothetical protein
LASHGRNLLTMEKKTVYSIQICLFICSFWFFDSQCNAQGISALISEGIKPVYSYKFTGDNVSDEFSVQGTVRVLDLKGMKGINPTSIHSRLVMTRHNINENESGTMNIRVFFLEEINVTHGNDAKMGYDNKWWRNYPLVSDFREVGQADSAIFGMFYNSDWHPGFYTKIYKGRLYPDRLSTPQKAFVCTEHFSFKANRWYQFSVTWNKLKQEMRMYANGVLIGTSDKFHTAFHFDKVRETLFAGNPVMCFNSADFYNVDLSGEELFRLYKESSVDFDSEYDKYLRHIFTGTEPKSFIYSPGKDWNKQIDFIMNEAGLLNNFYLQGYSEAVKVTGEGLCVETPNLPQQSGTLENQVYIWNRKFLEGDLYVEYEFKILSPGGLSLLMAQASGVQREPFMIDYKPRINGNMSTVTGQGVRNYHWEYYREMNDVRNDIASGGLMKNPFAYPLSYGTFDRNLDHEVWHKLQFLQQGSHIIGAIDGRILVEAEDNAAINNGPVLNCGYIAIRCMIHTKMLFRNLKVYNRNNAYKVVDK